MPTSLTAAASPSAARASIRDLRTPTSANSAATKNPLAKTSRITDSIFITDQNGSGVSIAVEASARKSSGNKLAGSSISGTNLSIFYQNYAVQAAGLMRRL